MHQLIRLWSIVELTLWTGIGGLPSAQTVISGQTTLLHPIADLIMAFFIRLTSP